MKNPIAVPSTGGSPAKQKLLVGRDDLQAAADEGLISDKQADQLWNKLLARQAGKPGFDLANLAWYSGAAVVMIAMGWFLVEVWDLFSGAAILATSAAYALFFLAAARHLWSKEDLKVPGGLMATLAVAMTPTAIYGLQRLLGMWDVPTASFSYEVARRLMLEGGTVLAGLVALRFFRFPFITAPVSLGILLTAMEMLSLVAGHEFGWRQYRTITLVFGLAMVAGSYIVDLRTRGGDFAFWGYLVGVSAFWISLSLMDSGSELGRFLYFLVNAAMMGLSVLLRRRVFLVYGAAGVVGYLGYLAFSVFQDSMVFPIALSAIGVAIIFLGIKYHRNRARIEKIILGLVPESLRSWLPAAR
jgi:hypothetical protein